MTSIKSNQFTKEQVNTEKNYQLNMDILTSLKSLPGKVIKLQSEKIIFNNVDINKKVIFPEEKFSTSSSISKELLSDPFSSEGEKFYKKSYSTNSAFKPITFYPIKRTSLNYCNFGSIMSFSDFLVPDPSLFNPLKITDGSFSKNSFCNFMNQENGIAMNSGNNYNPNYNGNSIKNINNFNTINPIMPFLPNFSSNPLVNEQILKKNNLSQTKNNNFLNRKRSLDCILKPNFNIKEIKEHKEEEPNCIKNEYNNAKSIPPKNKNKYFYIKQSKTHKVENPTKKNLFIVIQKSKYVYRKRKPRKKKLFNAIRIKIKCGHEGCEGVFKTKKQLVYHHYKMNVECHNDTISFLKMINSTKILLFKNCEKKDEISKKYGELYKEAMKTISLVEHIETIVGANLEDEINKK